MSSEYEMNSPGDVDGVQCKPFCFDIYKIFTLTLTN